MSTVGKICGITSGILAAIMVFVLGVQALEECLVAAGSSLTVLPKGEWFTQLANLIHNYGLYILLLLCLAQIFTGRSQRTAGIAFVVYLVIAVLFIAVVFFKDDIVKLLK